MKIKLTNKYQGEELRNSIKAEYVIFYKGQSLLTIREGAINSKNGIILRATLPSGEKIEWRSNDLNGRKGFSFLGVNEPLPSELRVLLEYKLGNKC